MKPYLFSDYDDKYLFLYLDINECSESPDICGLGTCTNNGDGTFYQCDCQDGAMLTGTSSDGSLTCVGEFFLFVFSFNGVLVHFLVHWSMVVWFTCSFFLPL